MFLNLSVIPLIYCYAIGHQDGQLFLFFDSNNIEREINYELEKVNLWLKANKLSLNVKKTKCMFFHKRKTLPHINLSLNDVIIENVPKFNYLGIIIDEHLS